MKHTIFNNWNLMRFLRLGLGMAIVVQSVMAANWAMVLLGLLFTAMPVLNIGCCGSTGCAPTVKKSSTSTKDMTYEEVV